MVRPALPALCVDKVPTSFGTPTLCLISPRPFPTSLYSPSTNARLAEAALHMDLHSSWCTTKLHPCSPSPSSTSNHRSHLLRAAGRHDHLLQTAAVVPNFYEVLGLADDVAIPDIKAAYRQMARKYHPDVCTGSEVEESTRRFMEVQEAYETLSDPARRASYDRRISSLPAASRWGWSHDKEVAMNWRPNWEDQLFNMRQKGMAKAAQNPDSWGARMRKQWQEQEQHQQDREYVSS